MKYNHDTMFEGVKNVWCDGGGCHWCGRDTREETKGHDGFCPVPVMFTLEAENEVLKGELREERRRLLTELYQNSAISEYQFTLAMKEIDELTGENDDKCEHKSMFDEGDYVCPDCGEAL